MTNKANGNGQLGAAVDRRLRVALYSHDAMGVGHVRRNLLIAQLLGQSPHHATTLMICGVHEATAFCGGCGVDCLTIPSLEKVGDNNYRSRDLHLSKEDIITLREATLRSSLHAFRPDLLVVDKVPKGLEDELVDILPSLRAAGTRIVFGMREILDDPKCVKREWKTRRYEQFLQDNYDGIWIYGDPQMFDAATTYGLESLRDQIYYTGYFDQRERLQFTRQQEVRLRDDAITDMQTTLCMVGGGQDGVALAEAFSRARFPNGERGLLVTGPLMATDKVAQLELVARDRPDLTVVRSVPEADLLVQDVKRVVCMGGYNSLLSVVSFETPALIVPRILPRLEQSIRAELFRQNNLVDVLAPSSLSSAAITEWLAHPPTHARPQRHRIDLSGGRRVREFVSQMFPATTGNTPADTFRSLPA